MSISTVEARPATASAVALVDDTLTVELLDGRTIAVPLAWYPRPLAGSVEERSHWRLIGQGRGIHWPDLDEDISVQNLLDGKPSGESQRSLKNWQDRRGSQTGSSHYSGFLMTVSVPEKGDSPRRCALGDSPRFPRSLKNWQDRRGSQTGSSH